MKVTAVFVMLFFTQFNAGAQTAFCECTPTVEQEAQNRTVAKHETNFSRFVKKNDTITVNYVYALQQQYQSEVQRIKRKTGRLPLTPEDTLYTLKGYMWFVKRTKNDCDLHIEIGTANPKDARIIVEVPQEAKTVVQKIFVQLQQRGLPLNGCDSLKTKKHFPRGIPVVVTGLGFYDVAHKAEEDHGDKHTQAYAWELHPVADIVFQEGLLSCQPVSKKPKHISFLSFARTRLVRKAVSGRCNFTA